MHDNGPSAAVHLPRSPARPANATSGTAREPVLWICAGTVDAGEHGVARQFCHQLAPEEDKLDYHSSE
jgi:hypothetical protein